VSEILSAGWKIAASCPAFFYSSRATFLILKRIIMGSFNIIAYLIFFIHCIQFNPDP